jgi:hypothetical protein
MATIHLRTRAPRRSDLRPPPRSSPGLHFGYPVAPLADARAQWSVNRDLWKEVARTDSPFLWDHFTEHPRTDDETLLLRGLRASAR